MRSIHDPTTEEAYRLAAEHFGHALPPLDAAENEDWGRDYVLLEQRNRLDASTFP